MGMAAAPTVRSCPRHYGICVSHKYEEWKNLGEATVKDTFHGQRMVPDQLFWLIRQGDAILPFDPITTQFGVRCKFTKQQYDLGSSVRITFVASSILEPPSTMGNFSRCKIECSFLLRILKQGLGSRHSRCILADVTSIAENEVIYLDVDSKKIPHDYLQKQKKAGGGSYLTADLEVVFSVSDAVRVSVMHNNAVLTSVATNL